MDVPGEGVIRAVLFDVDDTLFDRRRAQRKVARLLAVQFPDLFATLDICEVVTAFVESDRMATLEFESTGLVESARAGRMGIWLGLLGLPTGQATELSKAYVEIYPKVHAPVAGAERAVAELAKGLRLGVVSNGISDVQYQKIETLGLRGLFDCVLLSEEVGVRKPDPLIFWLAAQGLGVKPQECLHVGDSYEADVVGATRAGMHACWFNPAGAPLPNAEVRPALEIRALCDLVRSVFGPVRTCEWVLS
jgi:HAD superfamily hydrolase (TIGR01509 family)